MAFDELQRLVPDNADPNLVVTFYGQRHDDHLICQNLKRLFPNAQHIGATSSSGVLFSGKVPHPDDLGLMLLNDPGGDYGVGSQRLEDNPAAAAERALQDALEACGCSGELPAMVVVYQPPGNEERVLEGLRRVVGNRCPIVGGSAADDDVSGRWRVLASSSSGSCFGADVVAVVAMFPIASIASSFQSGYAPTGMSGHATRALGRSLLEIDGRPAARVYNEWTKGAIGQQIDSAEAVLAETALAPLGVAARIVAGVPQHRLIHPAAVRVDGGLDSFAEIAEGDVVELMEGSIASLSRRAARVLDDARLALPDPSRFSGALLVYCGGCAMALGDAMEDLSTYLAEAADGRPVMGVLTFGEQGMLTDACAHGNLMVSAIAFSE